MQDMDRTSSQFSRMHTAPTYRLKTHGPCRTWTVQAYSYPVSILHPVIVSRRTGHAGHGQFSRMHTIKRLGIPRKCRSLASDLHFLGIPSRLMVCIRTVGLPTPRERVPDSLGGTSRSPGTGTKGLSGYRLSVSKGLTDSLPVHRP